MKNKIIFLTIILAIFKLDIVSARCDDSTLSRAKSIASNVNITYDYHFVGNIPYFDITLTNLTKDIYFVDTLTNKTYRYANTKNGEITIYNYRGSSGSYEFYSTNSECSSVTLTTKYYSFPIYNEYYKNEECKGLEKENFCKKWVNKYYSYDDFITEVNNYKSGLNNLIVTPADDMKEYKSEFLNTLANIYVKYYYIILILIILVCSIFIVIKRKKERFDI